MTTATELLSDHADQDMLRVLAELYGENAQAMLLMAKEPPPGQPRPQAPYGKPQELPPVRRPEAPKKHIKRTGK